MQLDVYKIDGTTTGEKVSLSESIFGIKPNNHAIYQAVVAYLANQRQGTHKTKTHGEVAGSGKKLWRQKHTGRARMGSLRSPLWRGGGTIFGPVPRDYSIKLPKKIKQLARKSALSYKAKDGSIKVVEDFSFETPKTKEMVSVLKSLGVEKNKVLVLTSTTNEAVMKSGRNLPRVNVLEAVKASAYDILNSQIILIQKSALEVLEKNLQA
jgi:large subunit ribosomal protein L4